MGDGAALATLWDLARLGRRTADELRARQDARLRRLLRHTYQRVPLYRRLFDEHGVRPEMVRGAGDLPRLPTTSRSLIQAAPATDCLSGDPGDLIAVRTAGTTARPLVLYRARGEERLRSAIRLRALHDLGVRPWDRQVGLALAPRPRDPRKPSLPQRTLRAVGLYRRERVDLGAGLPAVVEALRRLRPDVLLAYPSVLARLADHASPAARADVRPRLCIVGAEVLTPALRATIEATFGTTVLDWYGCHETGLIAWQCRPTGLLHVAGHNVALEVIRDGRPAGPGESGEAVVTSLHGYAMPFVRYRLGDVVTLGPEPCPCGAPVATVRAIEGRTWETVSLANGRTIHPVALNRLVQTVGMPWVGQYQLVQEAPDRVAFRIALRAIPGPEHVAAMQDALGDLAGPGVRVEVRLETEIEAGPAGKFRQVRPLPPDLPAGAVP